MDGVVRLQQPAADDGVDQSESGRQVDLGWNSGENAVEDSLAIINQLSDIIPGGEELLPEELLRLI